MKVIAKTETGYLLDASDSEIAAIQALSHIDKRFVYPKAGDEIKISEVYEAMSQITKLDYYLKEAKYIQKGLGELTPVLENLVELRGETPKELEYQPANRY